MGRVASRPITAEEFFELAGELGPAELIHGEVAPLTPAGGEHGVVALRLGARLLSHVEARGLGYVFAAETGFVLATEPDTVRAPDVAFLSHQRLGDRPIPKTFLRVAPDLAVEVVSPSEAAEAIQEKVRDYFAAGTLMVWVLYPVIAAAHVYRSPTGVEILDRSRSLSGGDVVPGFSCSLADLFA